MPLPSPKSDALRVAEIRDLLPTSLGSAEIRDQIAAEVRANAVFVSRAANVVFLSKVKEVIDAVAGGQMDHATARVTLLETLRALGYTPDGGFPEVPPGAVPPALRGTLQDLLSHRRLALIVNTQVALMNGRGQQLRGMEPERLKQFPAWELVRVGSRRSPRNWGGTQLGTPPIHRGQPDLRSRWTIAGGNFVAGRLIALKGDPVWGELGGSGNFDDALDVDHPPFAFNSGMGWREIDRGECEALGVTGPEGETVDQWLAMDHPVQGHLPPPVISVRGAAPAILRRMQHGTPTAVVGHAITPPGNAGELRSQIAARRAAREARRSELAQQATDRAAAAYAAKGGGQ